MKGKSYGGESLEKLMKPIGEKAGMFDFMGAMDELNGIRERLG